MVKYHAYFSQKAGEIMKCSICGKEIKMNCGNWKLIDGKPRHVKCPASANRLSKEEGEKYKELMNRITYHLNVNPAGYVKETGLNFRKVANQIKALKDKGYSYEDQLYALDECVKAKEGFWGYTSVCNNIDWIIDKRNKLHEKQKRAEQSNESEEKIYDLTDMIKDKEDEWI